MRCFLWAPLTIKMSAYWHSSLVIKLFSIRISGFFLSSVSTSWCLWRAETWPQSPHFPYVGEHSCPEFQVASRHFWQHLTLRQSFLKFLAAMSFYGMLMSCGLRWGHNGNMCIPLAGNQTGRKEFPWLGILILVCICLFCFNFTLHTEFSCCCRHTELEWDARPIVLGQED